VTRVDYGNEKLHLKFPGAHLIETQILSKDCADYKTKRLLFPMESHSLIWTKIHINQYIAKSYDSTRQIRKLRLTEGDKFGRMAGSQR
jgi:hypothetical protein